MPITEALIIKHLRIYDKASFKKPLFEITLYPFESTEVFRGEALGLLITATSIILRYLYLSSIDPLRLQATVEEVRRRILNIFRHKPFNQYKWNELVSHLFQNSKRTASVIKALNIYYVTGDDLVYIHPSIFENLSILYGDFDFLSTMKLEDLKTLVFRLLEVLKYIKHHPAKFLDFTQLPGLREMIKNKLGLNISYNTLKRFILSLIIAWESIIPISKFISLPRPLCSWHTSGGGSNENSVNG